MAAFEWLGEELSGHVALSLTGIEIGLQTETSLLSVGSFSLAFLFLSSDFFCFSLVSFIGVFCFFILLLSLCLLFSIFDSRFWFSSLTCMYGGAMYKFPSSNSGVVFSSLN